MQYQVTAKRGDAIFMFGVEAEHKALAVIKAVKFLSHAPWRIEAVPIDPPRFREQ